MLASLKKRFVSSDIPMTAMARRTTLRTFLLALLGFATCNFVVPRLPTSVTAPRVTRMPARESALPRQSFMAGAKGEHGNMEGMRHFSSIFPWVFGRTGFFEFVHFLYDF